MAEKRRGLGRGLGALIPSAPVEEVVSSPIAADQESELPLGADVEQRTAGRPADLFFERGADSAGSEQPRSYSSALRSGINKNVLEAQTKRVGKTPARKAAQVKAADTVESSVGSTTEVNGAQQSATPSAHGHAAADEGDSFSPVQVSPPVPADVRRAVKAADKIENSGADSRDVDVPRETPDGKFARAGSNRPDDDALIEVPGATFAEIALDNIHPNRKQPRTEFDEDELSELVHSIREIGVLQPIVVRPSQEGSSAAYELVMGERRWRASREAGRATVPAIIRSTVDDDLLRDALLENLHRSALNPLEEAAAYQQLLDDFGCSHDELAGRLGRSRPQISNTLRLMKLPPLVQRRLAAGVLSAGHARALLGLEDAAEMEKLAQRIVAEGLSVRSTEEIVALSGGLRRASRPGTPRDGARHERLDYLATSLSDRLDTSVKITLGAKKGRVSIEFASVDDLNRIIGVLTPSKE